MLASVESIDAFAILFEKNAISVSSDYEAPFTSKVEPISPASTSLMVGPCSLGWSGVVWLSGVVEFLSSQETAIRQSDAAKDKSLVILFIK